MTASYAGAARGVKDPRDRLRILHVDPERGFGGGETQVLGLMRHLVAAGQQQELAADPRGALALQARTLGITVNALAIRHHADVLAGRRLARLMAREGYDIVHFHTARAHAMSIFLGRSLHARRLVTRRMDYPLRGGWYVRRLYNRSVDGVVAISEAVASVLVAGGVEAGRIRVIPSGVELERFVSSDADRAAARARLGLAAGEIAVVVVAALEARKGHTVLLDAVATLPALPLRVLLAGSGSQRAALEAQVAALGLGARVTFLGAVTDVPALLAAADVVVMASLAEGLGVAALEALAAGRPVIASRSGGLPEVIGHDVCGLLVDPGDRQQLAEAIRRMADDPDARIALGRAGRDRVRAGFSMAGMAHATLAFYRQLASADARDGRAA